MPRNSPWSSARTASPTAPWSTALEDGAAAGPQVLRIPFDPGDLQKAYTVQLRRKTRPSAGIPTNQVLIHEIKNGTPYLLRTP